MAGVYIHVPFCKKACNYCNFHFSTNTNQVNEFVMALLAEIELRQQYINEPVETIYFGGGTPSLLSGEHLHKIIVALKTAFMVNPEAELTLEANPDDITAETLLAWKQMGVNRLSLGVQSFFDDDLQWMNRAHNAGQAEAGILLATKLGFSNLSVDLIYGTPTLTDVQWRYNVQQIIDLNVNHLSCYALTVEPKTALHSLIKQNKVAPVEEEKQARHFELLTNWMEAAGYEQYEISNFARPGHKSRHNSSYWNQKPYIGLGPSAHSFNGRSRQWNIANNALYIQSLQRGTLMFEQEILTPKDQLNEYIMTSLRTSDGINLQLLQNVFGQDELSALSKSANSYLENNLLVFTDNHLVLTKKGKFLADGIAAALFAV